MRKAGILILFWIACLPLNAQVNSVIVEGYVTDLSFSSPIVNHAVTIQSISPGILIHDVVYTSQTGFYIDTLIYNTGAASDSITISTYDCNQHVLSDTLTLGLSNEIIINFLICGGCHALFSDVPDTGNPMNINFNDQSTGNNIASWSWDFGDGTTSNLQNPVHLYVQPNKYKVCLKVRSNDSICNAEYCDSITINSNGGCQAQFTWYADSLIGIHGFHFTDLSSGATSWHWNFGDSLSGPGNTSLTENPEHVFTAAGTYHVCLTIRNQSGTCQSTWCANINSGGTVGCSSYFTFSQNLLTVTFQGYMVSGIPASYSWSFGDGSSGTGQNITHIYPSNGMYYVSLKTVTDSANCNYSSGMTIPVGDSTQFHQVNGQVLANNFPLSAGVSMIFSIDSSTTNPYYDRVSLDSSGLYSFNYLPQGNFVVWIIPVDSINYLPTYYGNVTDWHQATVISLGTPLNPYNIGMVSANKPISGSGGINGHMITNKATNSLVDKIRMILLNEFGAALQFSNMRASGVFNFADLAYGVYYLRAELPGCTSDLVRVELTQNKPIANVVMTYTGNKLLGTDANEPFIEGLSTYPNPVTDQLTLNIVSKKNASISLTICNLSGRNLISEVAGLTTGSNMLQINTSGLPSGLFILKITSDDGILKVRKVIKS
jgi:PKD repeat protein